MEEGLRLLDEIASVRSERLEQKRQRLSQIATSRLARYGQLAARWHDQLSRGLQEVTPTRAVRDVRARTADDRSEIILRTSAVARAAPAHRFGKQRAERAAVAELGLGGFEVARPQTAQQQVFAVLKGVVERREHLNATLIIVPQISGDQHVSGSGSTH